MIVRMDEKRVLAKFKKEFIQMVTYEYKARKLREELRNFLNLIKR